MAAQCRVSASERVADPDSRARRRQRHGSSARDRHRHPSDPATNRTHHELHRMAKVGLGV